MATLLGCRAPYLPLKMDMLPFYDSDEEREIGDRAKVEECGEVRTDKVLQEGPTRHPIVYIFAFAVLNRCAASLVAVLFAYCT